MKFKRERIETYDGDFIDLDHLKNNNTKVAILCHGLEGSSNSKYISGMSSLLSKRGYDICAMNYRFCSGEINRTSQMYHSGWTIDLHTCIQHIEKKYDELYLVGFSLGGNLVCKYAGENTFIKTDKLKAIAAISVPLNLYSSAIQMERWQNYLYTKRFLTTLNQKITEKHEQFPYIFNLEHLPKIKTVKDFDDYYTGPLNGFVDAKDYYRKCSSDQFLSAIKIPTLIINAKDDPFLGSLCFPPKIEVNNHFVTTHYPHYGGHVAFYKRDTYMWSEIQVLNFFLSSNKK